MCNSTLLRRSHARFERTQDHQGNGDLATRVSDICMHFEFIVSAFATLFLCYSLFHGQIEIIIIRIIVTRDYCNYHNYNAHNAVLVYNISNI